MGIFKRGEIWWYKFNHAGRRYQQTTHQHNADIARTMEAAHRTSLALGEVGIRDKEAVPTLADFLTDRILPWAESTFTKTPKSLKWFRNEARALKLYKPIAGLALDQINGSHVATFAAWRAKQGLAVATINSSIRVLRRTLSLAVEWGVIAAAPKVKVLGGAARRDHVVTSDEETAYLAVATEPLRTVAIVLVDSGLRPEECFRLRWEYLRFFPNAKGAVEVPSGKTGAARRTVPMTRRVYGILHSRWTTAGKPTEGWVFPAPKAAAGHIVPNSIYEPHLAAVKAGKVRPFVLYSLRHTFLTRLGESGADAWTLARIAGHSSITISQHYVHSSDTAVLDAIKRFDKDSYKSGYSAKTRRLRGGQKLLVSNSSVKA